MPLTTDEVGLLRQEVESWMVEVVDLYRETTADDPYGGQGVTEALVLADIPAMVQSGVAHEQVLPNIGAFRDVHLFTVTLPAETDVRTQDNLVVKTMDNIKLRVQAVLRPETNELQRPVIATTEL